jgi:hypothetical protein
VHPFKGLNRLQTSVRERAWLWGTLGLVLVRSLPNVRYLIGRDQAIFCVSGQALLDGKVPYRDFWDTKSPGIFYVYAPIVKIFGHAMWSIGVVDIVWLLAISSCLFYFGRRYFGSAGAALGVIVFAFRHCRQGYVHAAEPECFLVLCVLGAWLLLQGTHRCGWARHFAAGLLLGAAFWLKYNSIVFFPVVLVLPFVDFHRVDEGECRLDLVIPLRQWFGRMLIVAAGYLLAVAGVLAWIGISGAWPAMREVQFVVVPRYVALAFHRSEGFPLWALRQTQVRMGVWWEIMPAVSLSIALRRRELSRIAPLSFLGLAAYLATAMQARFTSYHFEVVYPFFAMFWAYVGISAYDGARSLERIFVQRQWTVARWLLWGAGAGLMLSLLPEEGIRMKQQYQFAADWWRDPESSYKSYYWQLPQEKIGDQMRVIDYLKLNSQPRDQVYVWGTAPLINFLPQRENPTRFSHNMGLMSAWTPDSLRNELVRVLEAKRPRYIVVERNDRIPSVTFTSWDSEQYLSVYPALAGLLHHEYQPAIDFTDFGVYRRK